MFDLASLTTFIIAAFVVVIVPGITVSAIVSTALARGFKAGMLIELGAQIGRLSMVVLVAVALEAVTVAVTASFFWIKLIGAVYLAWIGWGYLSSRSSITLDKSRAEPTAWRQVVSGFFVLWSNPKAFLFFGAFLPQFVNPNYPAWPQVVILGLIEMGAALITDTAYIIIASRARHLLTGKLAQYVNKAAGVILIGAAVWLALQHQA
ncbi:LysE family translocator [Paradevosia shaoguanensis]|uniref:LysE family translocator n=1 Tax=Paradevosia shaoguanensis TaxID=1335043 RepID=UPI003C73E3F3